MTSLGAASANDYKRLVEIWENSVRATHHFLAEDDLAEIREALAESYFPAVELIVARTDTGEAVGFAGISGDMLEMLFVHPGHFGQGLGSLLLDYVIKEKGVTKVDVNEQNEGALGFYLSKGFRVVSRDESDPSGKPYPILHLSL